jgi:hypothetical protein
MYRKSRKSIPSSDTMKAKTSGRAVRYALRVPPDSGGNNPRGGGILIKLHKAKTTIKYDAVPLNQLRSKDTCPNKNRRHPGQLLRASCFTKAPLIVSIDLTDVKQNSEISIDIHQRQTPEAARKLH